MFFSPVSFWSSRRGRRRSHPQPGGPRCRRCHPRWVNPLSLGQLWLPTCAAGWWWLGGFVLCPAQQLCTSPRSWHRRATHTWVVPIYSFQAVAASHTPDFPLRWPKAWCLFVQLQNQVVLQAGEADGQSWDVFVARGAAQIEQRQCRPCLSHVKPTNCLITVSFQCKTGLKPTHSYPELQHKGIFLPLCPSLVECE